jgi:hypothetical protein
MIKVRLDPLSLVFIFYSAVALLFLRTVIPDQFVRDSVELYLLITAISTTFVPFLGGRDVLKLSPILPPLKVAPLRRALPFVTIFAGTVSIIGIEYGLTYGGFFPTFAFWDTNVPRILYGSGAILEEFYFRFVPFLLLSRIWPRSLEHPAIFLLFIAPVNSLIFTAYHLLRYAESNLALSIVFAAGYVFNASYRFAVVAGYMLLWVPILLHVLMNLTAAPA